MDWFACFFCVSLQNNFYCAYLTVAFEAKISAYLSFFLALPGCFAVEATIFAFKFSNVRPRNEEASQHHPLLLSCLNDDKRKKKRRK